MKRTAAVAVAAFVVAACGNDDGGSVEAFCESTQDLVDSEEFLNIEIPENFENSFEETREIINALADNAPDEISDDAETAARVTGEMLDSLADVDPADEEELLAVLEPFIDADDDPEFAAAVANINEYALTECGIELFGTDG